MQPFTALRRRRSLLCIFVFVALLAAQLAVAAYACPLLAQGIGSEAPPPCHQIDGEAPSLCKAFLNPDDQSLESPRLVPDLGAALATGIAVDSPRLAPRRDLARLGAAVPPATPPPLIVVLGRRRD